MSEKTRGFAEFDDFEPRRCEDIEGIVAPEIGPKSFETFEKQAPGRGDERPRVRTQVVQGVCNIPTHFQGSLSLVHYHWPLSYHFSIICLPAHSLPMFREKRYKTKKKVKEADRKDPLKSHRPDLPVTGPGECSYVLKLRPPFVFQCVP